MKNNLRSIRKHRKRTLREVADDIGISYQSISHYENGIRVPTIDVINKLSSYYQVEASLLFPNDNDPIPPDFLGDDELSHEGLKKHYNPVKKVTVYSGIRTSDFSLQSIFIVDRDYIYRHGTGTGSYFGWLISTNDLEPFYFINDILIFRFVNGLVTNEQNKHNRIFLSIEKNLSNRLYRMSSISGVFLIDIITNEVFSYSTFDRSKIVGQLIEIHKRVEI